MKVIQLVGRLAGQEIELPYAEAQACLAAGTVTLPDQPVRMKGIELPKTKSVETLPVETVIAMGAKKSGVPFLTFKAEAKKLLGDDMPASKTAILNALKAL